MRCQLRSGSQSPRPPAACTRSANCGPGAGPGLEAKAKWSEHLDQHIWMQTPQPMRIKAGARDLKTKPRTATRMPAS
uniref:Uncharacterized protein n=1 Tax=Mustela putorius furo TaxID=9669 RepID=M3YVM8_MUSPF